MKQTVDRIVRASSLPLSVVIVGVGGADFSNMVSKGSLPTSLLVYIHISMLTWAIPIVDSVVLVDTYSTCVFSIAGTYFLMKSITVTAYIVILYV